MNVINYKGSTTSSITLYTVPAKVITKVKLRAGNLKAEGSNIFVSNEQDIFSTNAVFSNSAARGCGLYVGSSRAFGTATDYSTGSSASYFGFNVVVNSDSYITSTNYTSINTPFIIDAYAYNNLTRQEIFDRKLIKKQNEFILLPGESIYILVGGSGSNITLFYDLVVMEEYL